MRMKIKAIQEHRLLGSENKMDVMKVSYILGDRNQCVWECANVYNLIKFCSDTF